MIRRMIVLAAALACLAGSARGQSVVFGVGGQLSAPLSETMMVPIYADLTGAPGIALGSFTVRVTWNPDSLSLVGCDCSLPVERAEFAGALAVNTDSSYYGILKVAGASGQGVLDVVELFRIPMQFYYYSSYGTTPIDIEVTEASAAGTFEDLLPFVTTVSGIACPAVGRWGDLDQDGQANSRDALAVLSSVVGLAVPGFDLTLGDVDGDGLANSRDALILLSYAVGIDIVGQRVLLVAPGACVVPEVPQLAIVPDTVDLAVGQRVRPLLVSADGGGAPTTVTVLNWAVDDPAVAAMIDETGLMVGRQAGATVLRAALGPGVIVTAPVVVRDQRGTWHVDTERALNLQVQLGTQRYPLASPNLAFPAVAEGDTIRFSPGTHEWNQDYYYDYYYYGYYYSFDDLYAGVFFVGDTLADGTRPIVRGPQHQGRVWWYDGVSGRIQNLVLENTYFRLYGLQNLHVENVSFEFTNPSEVIYVYDGRIDTLSIVNAEFVSPGIWEGSTYAVSVWDGASYVRLHDSRFERFHTSVYLYDVDSLDVQRNEFRFTDLAVGSWSYSSGGRPFSTAIVIDNVVDSAGLGLWASADSVIMTDNVLTQITEDGLAVEETYGRAGTGMVVARNQVFCQVPGSNPYGIQVYGVPGVIEDNTVTNCRYYGMYVNEDYSYPLATVAVRRNQITMPDRVSSSYGMYLSGRLGLVTLYGNTVRNGYYGVYYSPSLNNTAGDTTRLVADSNAISGTGYTALYPSISTSYTGSVVGVRNNISGNLGYGVYTSFNGPLSLTLGRFVGNGEEGIYPYAVRSSYAFDATQNWWGDPAGAGGGVADSVIGAVDVSSPLTSDPTDVPALAPSKVSGMAFGEAAGTAERASETRRALIHGRVERAREAQRARQQRQ